MSSLCFNKICNCRTVPIRDVYCLYNHSNKTSTNTCSPQILFNIMLWVLNRFFRNSQILISLNDWGSFCLDAYIKCCTQQKLITMGHYYWLTYYIQTTNRSVGALLQRKEENITRMRAGSDNVLYCGNTKKAIPAVTMLFLN